MACDGITSYPILSATTATSWQRKGRLGPFPPKEPLSPVRKSREERTRACRERLAERAHGSNIMYGTMYGTIHHLIETCRHVHLMQTYSSAYCSLLPKYQQTTGKHNFSRVAILLPSSSECQRLRFRGSWHIP